METDPYGHLCYPQRSLAWPDRFFPFVLGRGDPTQKGKSGLATRPNTKGKKRSGHARLPSELWFATRDYCSFFLTQCSAKQQQF